MTTPDTTHDTTQDTTHDSAPAPENMPQKKSGWLSGRFAPVARYLKADKGFQPGAIIASILLSTTALATPVLGTAIGAGLALGAGLYLLSKTSDTVLNNSRAIGHKMGINPMALGVALGVLTSMPELFVSMGAMISGSPGIGIGNVVGSNIANILLILGGTAAIKKINTKGVDWKFNAMAMGAATLLFGAQMAMGVMSPVIGVALLAGTAGYLWKSIRDAKKQGLSAAAAEAANTAPVTSGDPPAPAPQKPEAAPTTTLANAPENAAPAQTVTESPAPATPPVPANEDEKENKLPKWANFALGFAGLAGLIGAASFVVGSAVALGTALSVSPAVVGLLAVAVGTSLPEIMVSLKAAKKGDAGIVIGNILGSNAFNFGLIGGILSLTGAPMPADFSIHGGLNGIFNTVATAGAAGLAIGALHAGRKNGISRVKGIASLGLYAAFTAATFLMGKKESAPDVAQLPPKTQQVVVSDTTCLANADTTASFIDAREKMLQREMIVPVDGTRVKKPVLQPLPR